MATREPICVVADWFRQWYANRARNENMSLRVTFLGTGGAVPTTERAPSAVLVNREGDRLLFDCGEGTQRQMMRFSTGFTVSHLFVSHLHGDHVLGIPGLIQTWDFNDRDEALAIHTPPGTRKQIESLVYAAGHEPSYPVRINEVSPGNVALSGDSYEIRAFQTAHRTVSQGYVLTEDERPGKFDRPKAEDELGIPPGPKYGRLHAGESIELDTGEVIHPRQVVGEPRPGRKLVYTGDTRPQDRTVDAASDADLLIHDATFAEGMTERAQRTAHSTATQAAAIAGRAGVRRLALTHVSSRYAGDASTLLTEAREEFSGDCVLPDDGTDLTIQYRETE